MALPIPRLIAVASGMAVSLGCSGNARGHGSEHEQIVAITAALEKKPGDSELLLLRAGLYRRHQDWEAAVLDIAAAEKVGASAGLLARARTEVAASRLDWDAAARELPVLARALPENAEAWRLAAAVHTARGQHADSIVAWRAVIKNARPLRPEDILSLARAQHAASADDDAIATLDAGAQRLGEISVFLEEAAHIEEARQRWDAALARLDRLIAQSPNSPRFLARKAGLAERAARPELAATTRRAALAAIEALPPARRAIPAFAELEKTLRTQLAESSDSNPAK